MASSLVRVADAPLPSVDTPTLRFDRDAAFRPASTAVPAPRRVYLVLLVWVLIHFTQFGFIDGTERWNIVLVVSRYLLWPGITIAVLFHLFKVGYGDLIGSFRYFIPFVAMGLVSSILGFSPVNSYRLMFFWLIGVFAAGVIGLESDQAALRTTLFWTFGVFVALSILTVVVDPKLGVMADSRVEGGGGAWRGLFPGKNLTGLICVYALIMAWFAPRPAPYIRAAAAAMATVLLVFAASQGAISLAAIMIEYVVLVGLMRRSNLSRGAQATLLVIVMAATVAALLIGATFLFQLLGRDATLSGRTEIWAAFLIRASYFWLLGAGPGSFSLPYSPIVADLAAQFRAYGSIHTPHNMFIAAFGETGIFGLLFFAVPLLYLAFVLPVVNRRSEALMIGTIAFTMIVGGITETREVFGPGMNMFLLILMIAAMRRSGGAYAAGAAPADETTMAGDLRDRTPPEAPMLDGAAEAWAGPRVLG